MTCRLPLLCVFLIGMFLHGGPGGDSGGFPTPGTGWDFGQQSLRHVQRDSIAPGTLREDMTARKFLLTALSSSKWPTPAMMGNSPLSALLLVPRIPYRFLEMSDSTWFDQRRQTYTYNQSREIIRVLTERWTNDGWENLILLSLDYDSDGNLVEMLWRWWRGSSKWENGDRRMYAYDFSGNMIEELAQTWENEDWENFYRYGYTYDEEENLAEVLYQVWEGEAWSNVDRQTRSYDSNGVLVAMSWRWWVNGIWQDGYEVTYSYDDSGNLEQEFWQNWRSGTLTNRDKYSYSYDERGNLLERLWELWNHVDWEYGDRYLYSYDTIDSLIQILREFWEDEQWNWGTKHVYTYDVDGYKIEWLWQRYENGAWVVVMRQTYSYDENGNLVQSLDQGLVIDPLSLRDGTNQPSDFAVLGIYPNPFNPTTTVEFSVPRSGFVTLRVYDLLGREVETILNKPMNPGRYRVQWNAGEVPSGIYFVRIQVGEPSQRSGQVFTQTRKVTVLR